MTNILKWSAISLVVAHFLNCACETLKTEFLAKFLEANLITLLIATLAINTATAGIILSRLSEMNARYKLKFPLIISAMKTAILEQLGLIIVATGFLILKTSKVVQEDFPKASFHIGTVIIAVLIYAVVAIYDTADAAFALNRESETLANKQESKTSQIEKQTDSVH